MSAWFSALPGELTKLFEIAFEGCGTTLELAASSTTYSRKLANVRREYGHVCGQDHLVHSIQAYLSETLRIGERGIIPSFSHEALGESARLNLSVVALIYTLGHYLIEATREMCFDQNIRQLAVEWRETNGNDENTRLLVDRLSQWLKDFRHSPSDTVVDENQRSWVDRIEDATSWWIADRARQHVGLFLPTHLRDNPTDRPNCQGQALLSAAFAREAGVQNLRVNLLCSGADILQRGTRKCMQRIYETAAIVDAADVSKELLALKRLELYEAIMGRGEVDFHSGCLLKCGENAVIVDPFAQVVYRLLEADANTPFEMVKATKLPGANVPVLSIDLHCSRIDDLNSIEEQWIAWLMENGEAIHRLKHEGDVAVWRADAKRLYTSAITLNARNRGYGAEDAGSICELFVREQEGELPFTHGDQTLTEHLIRDILDQPLQFLEEIAATLREQHALASPVSCEYGEPEYCTAFTTLQTIAVLNGEDWRTLRLLLPYGCDQSMMYLAMRGLSPTDKSQRVPSAEGVVCWMTLSTSYPLLLHPATRDLLREKREPGA